MIKVKLYWYKLESHFGPGHQSTEIRYLYTTGLLNRSARKEEETEEAYRIGNRYDTQVVTRLRLVKTVPDDVIKTMREEAERTIKYMQSRLIALNTVNLLGIKSS